jgi:hypothetical protein
LYKQGAAAGIYDQGKGEVKRKNKIIQPNPAQINNELWHASDWATLMDWELHMI